MKLQISILLICLTNLVFAQTKNEKEERIVSSEFPKNALQIIKKLPANCKRFKYYKETDGSKKSFEVKFKHKKKFYSIEFSEDGIIEDIEVLIKFKQIESSIKSNIKSYFISSFLKFKLIKVQQQFNYNPKIEPSNFVTDVFNISSKIAPNFEIIAEVKTDKIRDIKEFTFDKSGGILNQRTLKQQSYEHVLY